MFIRLKFDVLLFIFILSSNSFATLYRGDKCSLQDGSEGKCKLMKECPIAVQLIKTGIFPVICGLEKTKSIVCCKDGDVANMTIIMNRVGGRTPGDISKEKCKEYAEYAYEKIPSPTLLLKPHFTKKLVCDIPRNRLVVGSSPASRREFPHMALVGYYKSSNEVVWFCGGSVISEKFVLTAAHCLYSGKAGFPKLVRVGFTNKSDPAHVQERAVSEIIPYPEYDNPSRYHDIGLLRLLENLQFNTYVRPACLQTEQFIPYVSAIASGWGAVKLMGELSNDLLATLLEFYGLYTCNSTYRRDIIPFGNFTELKDGILDDFMICAGTSKSFRTTCQGDGGGPLQVYHQETEDVNCMYDIIGVTSFGKSCALSKNTPGVFTRVSAYIKWIEDTVWPN